jgi:hypothetical protein
MQCEYCLENVNSYYELSCNIGGVLKVVKLCSNCTSYTTLRKIVGAVSLGSTSFMLRNVAKKE